MNCIECGRKLGQPFVMTSAGAVGPKCAAALGLERPKVARDKAQRVRIITGGSRTRRNEQQLELAL